MLPEDYRDAGVLGLRTLEDADRILDFVPRQKDAIILGGGLVSLQVVQALSKQGITPTVIVSLPQILSRNVDEEVGSVVQEAMVENGISVRLGVTVLSCERMEKAISLHLETGEVLSSSLVVCGKGVKVDLLEGPLCTNESMRTDERMNTCIENIYGAGDVSIAKHLVYDQWNRIANWPNACYQGWVAGSSMAGGQLRLDGLLK